MNRTKTNENFCCNLSKIRHLPEALGLQSLERASSSLCEAHCVFRVPESAYRQDKGLSMARVCHVHWRNAPKNDYTQMTT